MIAINKEFSDLIQLLNPIIMLGIKQSVELFNQHEYFWEIIMGVSFIVLYALYYWRYRTPHFVIRSQYDVKKKNIGRPPPPYPNGWYNIAHAASIKPGEVRSVDIAGQNMVVYRGKDNVVYALEAYCLHMGANLGVGGEVVNQSCVQCPFHGWLYDGKSGHCVDHDGKVLTLKSVEYNAGMCQRDGKIEWKAGQGQKPKLRKYPVSEVNGYIYVWIHAMDEYKENPIYPLINVESMKKNLEYRGKTEHHIMCHIQDIPQNGADTLHFKYVHTYIIPAIKSIFFKWNAKWTRGDDPDLAAFFEHPRKNIREFKQRVFKEIIEPFPRKEFLSIGNLQNQVHIPLLGQWFMFSATIIQCGLGIVFIILKGPLFELIFHHYLRPQGKAYQQVYHDCYISPHVPYFISYLASQMEGGQVTNDMYVWSSKKFARKSFLVQDRESDKFIKGWRQWASQHYQGCEYQLKNQGYSW